MSRSPDNEGDSPFETVMRSRERPFRVIEFPGEPGVKVAIWAPTEDEEIEADAEARKRLTKVLGLDALQLSLAVDTELHSREKDLQILAEVLRDPTDRQMAWVASPDSLRKNLVAAQRRALMAALADFQRDRYAPTLPGDDADLARLMRDLKEVGGLSAYLTSCDGDTVMRIVHALAAPSPTQTPESSSAT